MDVELVGVPFDGYGRAGHQARAASALREAGLVRAFGPHPVVADADVLLPLPDPERGEDTSLVNEAALLAMAEAVEHRVARAVDEGRMPVVVGGDCSMLLGIVPGLGRGRPTGLLFVDGHEDTMPLDVSEDGEAANCEIGLLLGLTGRLARGPLTRRTGVLDSRSLALAGQRDEAWRRRFNVGGLRDHGVWARSVDETAADPAGTGRAAVEHLLASTDRWWLHVDLDVLDPQEFPAQGLPEVEDEPGGLTRAQLTDLVVGALTAGSCAGLSLAIYDPDQDPDGSCGRDVVALVDRAAAALS